MNKTKRMHIKKGDQVKVITGEQKGFLGIVNSIITKKSSLTLEGIVPRIKYVKNTQTKTNEDAKKVEIPVSIHISNVMLWDKQANKASRIGYKDVVKTENNSSELTKEKEKKRYFKKTGNLV